MDIIDVFAEGAYSYEKLHIPETQFNAGGVTAILGKSIKDKTANGSGKSTIFKVIYYALTGKELSKEAVSEISNRALNRGHFVQITLRDRGNILVIQRFQDFRPGPNSLIKNEPGSKAKLSGTRFFIDGVPFGDKAPNGEPMADSKVKQIIQERLGISSDMILSSMLTAQKTSSNFLVATDTKKKEIISELLGLEVYEEAYKTVNEEIQAKEKQISSMETRADEIDRETEIKKNDLISLAKKNLEFEKLKEQKTLNIQNKYISCEKDFFALSKAKPKTSDITPLVQLMSQKEERLNLLLKDLGQMETGKSDLIDSQIAECEATNKTLSKELGNINGQIQATSTQFDSSKFHQLENAVKSFAESKTVNLLEAKKEKESLEKAIALNNKQSSEASFKLEQLKKEVDSILNSKECPTCNRPWDKNHEHEKTKKIEDLTAAVSLYEKQIAECAIKSNEQTSAFSLLLGQIEAQMVRDELSALQTTKDKIDKLEIAKKTLSESIAGLLEVANDLNKKKFEFIKELREKMSDKQTEMQSLTKEVSQLKEQISAEKLSAEKLTQWEKNIADLKIKMMELAKEASEVKKEESPHLEMQSEINDRIKELAERKQNIKATIEEHSDELKYLNFWKSAFGPTGIRSFISDEVIVQLNELTRQYLSDISNGAINVVFESESVTGKGAVSNKIDTKFFLNGLPTPIGLLSGGEQQRVSIVVDLALSDIAEMRAGTKFSVKFLDEPFDGIDTNGQMQCLGLFTKIAKRKNGFFIVTHDTNFQALCQNIIYVRKDDQISEIVDKRGFDRA